MRIPPVSPIIAVEGLTACYGEETILEDVNFRVFQGEIFLIVGVSGCGKSTLLKNMIGLYPPCAGGVVVNGVDVNAGDEEVLREWRRSIGVLFQSGALFGSMTLHENLALPLTEHPDLDRETIDLLVRMKLGMVDLAGYENHYPATLSGGMRKRAALARAMVLDPTVLFFDEPSAGLDPVTAAEIDILIKSINSGLGTTMVIVTHELQSILNVAHRVIMLDKWEKGIIAEGDPMTLKEHATDPRVRRFFHRLASGGKEKGA